MMAITMRLVMVESIINAYIKQSKGSIDLIKWKNENARNQGVPRRAVKICNKTPGNCPNHQPANKKTTHCAKKEKRHLSPEIIDSKCLLNEKSESEIDALNSTKTDYSVGDGTGDEVCASETKSANEPGFSRMNAEIDFEVHHTNKYSTPSENSQNSESKVTTTTHIARENEAINDEKRKDKADCDEHDEFREAIDGLYLDEVALPYQIDKMVPNRDFVVLRAELETRENLRPLKSRLKTFECYQSEVMFSIQLAEAGFISLDERDAVGCVWCFLLVKEFKEYVNPTAIYQMHSHGKCEYLDRMEILEKNSYFSLLYQYDINNELSSLATEQKLNLPLVNEPAATQIEDTSLADHDQVGEVERYQAVSATRSSKAVEEVKTISYRKYNDCTHESYRLQTFADCPLFPEEDARVLAANGMQWSDWRIVCIFCAWSLKTGGDDLPPSGSEIVSKHDKSPSGGICRIKTGKNVPMVLEETCWKDNQLVSGGQDCSKLRVLGVNTNFSKHPEFAVIDRRRATFLTYPYGNGKNGDELAEAGYFYSGKGDSVICFSCGVKSAHWSVGEDAWQRHARSSTSCQFIIRKKEPGYISQVVEQHGEYTPPRQENKINSLTTRMLRPRMDSVVVQRCLKAGMSRDSVRSAVGKRIQKGEKDFTSTADVVRAVLELKVPEHALVPPIQLQEVSVIPAAERPLIVSVSSQRDTIDFLQTVGEFKTIAAQLTCKVCMNTPVGIVFLPCRHFVCCVACATTMVYCLLCKKYITGTHRANFPQQPASTPIPTVSELASVEQPCDDGGPQCVTEAVLDIEDDNHNDDVTR